MTIDSFYEQEISNLFHVFKDDSEDISISKLKIILKVFGLPFDDDKVNEEFENVEKLNFKDYKYYIEELFKNQSETQSIESCFSALKGDDLMLTTVEFIQNMLSLTTITREDLDDLVNVLDPDKKGVIDHKQMIETMFQNSNKCLLKEEFR